jgi:hypothetical protein
LLARTTTLESAKRAGATSRCVARSGGTEICSVNSAAERGTVQVRMFEGAADTSGHREVSDMTRKSVESLLKPSKYDRLRSRRSPAKTGKRVAKIGRMATKMKDPAMATRTITGIRRVGDRELQAISNAVGLPLSRVSRHGVFVTEAQRSLRTGLLDSLGTNPPVLSQYMLSTWWFHVQNTNTFLNQNMLSSFRIH